VLPVNPPDDNLAAALARHQIVLPPAQVELMARYCELLWDWNSKLNLTRHTDYEKFVARDLVDSRAFAQFLRPGERVLDVGAGGGVPGVLLAILRDDLQVSLAESVGKKARALADIVDRLGLGTPVLHARAEDVLIEQRFDTLVVRAVARLKKLLEWFRPHWEAFDRLLVLKGPSWIEERGEARHYGLLGDLALRKLTSYPLPGTASESVLLQIEPKIKSAVRSVPTPRTRRP
jgi:16S rRNA (guanine527-N7)-methyltransferase